MPGTIVSVFRGLQYYFLFRFTAEEAEVQGKFWHTCGMKYRSAITTLDTHVIFL